MGEKGLIIFDMLTRIFAFLVLNIIVFVLIRSEAYTQHELFDKSRNQITFRDVHVLPESKCDICHPPTVDVDNSHLFLKSDLCLSCHEDTVVVLPGSILRSRVNPMNNHPIKFSPLDFDSRKISQQIILIGKNIWISSPEGSLPLFGETRRSAVVECATCHDPHGTAGFKSLLRIDNHKSKLCIICHIDI
jgi:predicted CXXCH cytochrome family protein